MKSLLEFLKENCELTYINESLSSSWLQKLMASVKEKGLKNVNMNSFVWYSGTIRWDKVTDEYSKEYKAGDKDAVKIVKALTKRENTSFVILVKEGDVVGTISYGGYITLFSKPLWDGGEWRKNTFTAKRQYEAMDLVKAFDSVIYTFDKENDPEHVIINVTDDDSQYSRNARRNGMVLQGDVNYLYNLARENMKRYKDLVAQAKKDREFDEKLGERVKAAVQSVMDISMDMEQNPDKYNSTFGVERLLEMVYSTKSWNQNIKKYVGQNGILPLWKQYISDKHDIDKSGYADMYYRGAKNAKEALETMLGKLEEAIKNFK